jgi:hypothetical protein
MKTRIILLPLLLAAALAGCASLGDQTPPLTIDALVTRAKAGESTESLLASLRASRQSFALTGSDFAKLKERGLPDPVLDELQTRQISDARDEEWRRSQPIGWWRAWPHYGFHYAPRPIIVVPKPVPTPKS